MADPDNELIHLTIDVIVAFVGQNNMRPEEVPALIASVHKAVRELQANGSTISIPADVEPSEARAEYPPAVTVRRSLGSRDHILSMIDGKPYKTLKRHLGQHGLTPAQYRERYGLKADYPMVAPAYSEARKAMALKIGLGQKVIGKRGTAKSAVNTLARSTAEAPAITAAAPAGTKAPAKRSVDAAEATGKAKAGSAAEAPSKLAGKAAARTVGAPPAKRGRPAKAAANSAAATAQ